MIFTNHKAGKFLHLLSLFSPIFMGPSNSIGDLSGRAVKGVGLRPLACWDCGFVFHGGNGCLSVVSVVCCQVDVSATSWSLVQRSPIDCNAPQCDLKTSWMRRPWPNGGCCTKRKKKLQYNFQFGYKPNGGHNSFMTVLTTVKSKTAQNNCQH